MRDPAVQAAGPPQNLASFAARYRQPLVPAEALLLSFDNETGIQGVPAAWLPIIEADGIEALAAQLLGALKLFAELDAFAHTPAGVIEAGFVSANTSWNEYAQREAATAAANDACELFINSALAGPAATQSAAEVLNVCRSYLPGILRQALIAAGRSCLSN